MSRLKFIYDFFETDWILEVAKESSTIVGIVGWVDLTDLKVNLSRKY